MLVECQTPQFTVHSAPKCGGLLGVDLVLFLVDIDVLMLF